MQILWDEPKRQQNLAKHGLDFADFDPQMLLTASVTSTHSGRLKVIGILGGEPVTVVLKPTGREAISIVSMRPASRRERKAL
jgi:hypothetical protein